MRSYTIIVALLVACMSGAALAQIPDIVPITAQEALGPLAELPAVEESSPAVELPPAVVSELPSAEAPEFEDSDLDEIEPEEEEFEPAFEISPVAIIPVLPIPAPVPTAEIPTLTAPTAAGLVSGEPAPEVEVYPYFEDLLAEEGPETESILPEIELEGPSQEIPFIVDELEGQFIYLEVAPGGTPYQQTLYFLNSFRRIDQAFINAQRVQRTFAVDPPGWNWTYYGEALDLNAPLRVDLYDAEGNKVFTPISSLTSQSLGTQFGLDRTTSVAGYYPAGSFPPLSPSPGA